MEMRICQGGCGESCRNTRSWCGVYNTFAIDKQGMCGIIVIFGNNAGEGMLFKVKVDDVITCCDRWLDENMENDFTEEFGRIEQIVQVADTASMIGIKWLYLKEKDVYTLYYTGTFPKEEICA